MAVSVHATSSTHLTPPPSTTHLSQQSHGTRPPLPDRKVTEITIEDSYVDFILHCNPGVPLETDTAGLREAFRVPPKSDGNSFSTFTLFELIKQLESKELKTWAELALRLGVAPPDQEKGQSSQKIQQYAVRLKRWMHSMHVDAFFDYLVGRTQPYWMQIPDDPNPVCEEGRDGVAAEDDMALRALLPQIKPRRGRRKPDDDLNKSPSQRPRLGSPSLNGVTRPEGNDPWTAHPDGRRTFIFPPSDQARSSVLPTSNPAFPWPSEVAQTPFTAYPQSAMTPINGQPFWADPSEPRSATTPSKAKMAGRRHGAKVVSSAWRSAASGKTRGRPPINRLVDTPLSAHPDGSSTRAFPPSIPENSVLKPLQTTNLPTSNPAAALTQSPTHIPTPLSAPPITSRSLRPGRLSLQVPERPGGSVRLATPPLPVVVLNGDRNNGAAMANGETPSSATGQTPHIASSSALTPSTLSATPHAPVPPIPPAAPNPTISLSGPPSEQGDENVNVQEVESLFVSELLLGLWYDVHGNAIPPAGVDECVAVARTILGNMSKQALTPESFLLNLAALAGGSVLQKGVRLSITRLDDGGAAGATHNRYTCKWALRYGAMTGNFSLTESVPCELWKKKNQDGRIGGASDGRDMPQGSDQDGDAEHWKKMYIDLVQSVRTQHQETNDMRLKVLESLKGPPGAGKV